MTTKARALSLVMIALLAPAPTAFAQAPASPATEAWNAVKAVSLASELEVRTKNGKRLRGRLLGVSDTTLRLSGRDEISELDRESILKIYRLLPKSDEFRRLSGGIGATAGGSAGLAIGLSAARGAGSSAAAISIPIGLALGAIGGYLIGSRLKSRMLIYDAGGQQTSKEPRATGS